MLCKEKNPKPEDLIRCKFCVGKPLKLKSLLPHVRAFHSSYYKSDLSSFFYIAEKGQKEPLDPKFVHPEKEKVSSSEKEAQTYAHQDSPKSKSNSNFSSGEKVKSNDNQIEYEKFIYRSFKRQLQAQRIILKQIRLR